MRLPHDEKGHEQLSFFEHREFAPDPQLLGRVCRDQKTGTTILRWAVEKPEHEDVIPPLEMLNWFAELSILGRVSPGCSVEVWRASQHLLDQILADDTFDDTSRTKALVSYALVDGINERSLRRAVDQLRAPLSTEYESAGFDLSEYVVQALRLASYRPRRDTRQTFVDLHIADRLERSPSDDPAQHVLTMLNTLAARIYKQWDTLAIETTYHMAVDRLTREGISLPRGCGHDFAKDYAEHVTLRGFIYEPLETSRYSLLSVA